MTLSAGRLGFLIQRLRERLRFRPLLPVHDTFGDALCRVLLFTTLCLAAAAVQAQQRYEFPQGSVELLDGGDELGLYFQLAEHWHIYWKNAGDSGAAPKWHWQVSDAELGEARWPAPQRIPVEQLINFGYSDEALFRFPLQRQGASVPSVKLDLEFLVCKVECIPYFTTLSLVSPLAVTADAYAALAQRFSYPSGNSLPLELEAVDAGSLQGRLQLPSSLAEGLRNMWLFPEDGARFSAKAPSIDAQGRQYRMDFALQGAEQDSLLGKRLLMVLEYENGDRQSRQLVVSAAGGPGWWQILFWALLGGLILNVMPCVFPVLSIKLMSFLGPEREARQLRLSAWLYTLGIVLSFLILGGLLLALRAAGQQIGWGFQLQNPWFTAAMALLFFWLALNFLGLFEMGQSLMGVASRGHGRSGAFMTGVLATLVATPCTAPFMGAALGASLALAAPFTMVVFAGLGLGMALPFLALAYFPAALQRLPRPGRWMVRVKELLAFPLLATVVWLLWVVSRQLHSDMLILLLGLLTAIGFWVWLARQFASLALRQGWLLLGFLLSFAALAWLDMERLANEVTDVDSRWQVFSHQAVQRDVDAQKPVFIDFTAAWCITCQVNKTRVLDSVDVQRAFAQHKVQLYRADWTDRAPHITDALAGYGRNSLPVYVFYPAASGRPVLLPELLSKGMIFSYLSKENAP